jgi:NTP pyrophosphatase (non-canonical NTP hydrolase)
MSEIKELTEIILKFRNARDWARHHKPKDMAISLSLEASELLEHFQFKDEAAIAKHLESSKSEVADELSDVLYWVLLMSHDFGIDVKSAFLAKMKKNGVKYPINA